jgi:hypothetical protein
VHWTQVRGRTKANELNEKQPQIWHYGLMTRYWAEFDDIQLYGDFTDEPATADHKNLVFVAGSQDDTKD